MIARMLATEIITPTRIGIVASRIIAASRRLKSIDLSTPVIPEAREGMSPCAPAASRSSNG